MKMLGVFLMIGLMSMMAASVDARQLVNLRVIHASPDAPNVDVWGEGKIAFENAPFQGITPYKSVRPGNFDIQVVPAGATEPVVIDATVRFKPFRDYTVIATGTLADLQPLVIEDKRFGRPQNLASVRFIHASPDAPAVDIALDGGPAIFRDVGFREVEEYLTLPGDQPYDLEVRLAGTDTVVLDLDPITFENGMMYSAIAVGQVGDGTLGAILSVDR